MNRLLFLAVLLLATASTAPERFTPFAVPTGSWLQDPAFSPDGRSLFLTRIDPPSDLAIVITTLRDDAWSAPIVAPFSGHWADLTSVFSADGNEIIFASNRPARDGAQPIDGFWNGKPHPAHGGNLWSVERQGDSWGAPVRLPDAVNSNTSIFSPALAADGTLYFMHPSGPKNLFHLFIAKRDDGVYRASEAAPFSNDLDHQDVDPTVAPDNSFVIFTSNRPPARPGTADLFITFRHGDTWSAPQDMGRSIDPNGDAIEARLSPDSKTLYYTSNKAPHDLMHVDISQWTTRLATAGSVPERFAPFALPSGSFLQDPAFTSGGTALFLTRIDPNGDHTIVVTNLHDGMWSAPAVTPFSGHWRDLATVFSADGNEMIFASNRPVKDGGKPIDAFFGGKPRPQRGGNLWSVERDGNGWGAPVRLPDAVNSSTTVFSPALAADGTLYFMHPSGPKNSFHIFVSKLEDGVYRASQPAPFSNDAEHSDFDPTVAPDNSFVIFVSNRPPSRAGTADLFITFRHGDTWSAPQDMDRSIDPNGDAIEPRLSPDLKTLYYTAGDPSTLMRVDISPWVSRNDASQADPTMFAPGTISDGNVVSTPVFSQDGATLYFSSSINNRATIVESHLVGGTWTKPAVVSFSGRADDMDPTLAPDGSYMIFSSRRPVPGDASVAANLWRVDRTASGWSTPMHLPATVNVGDYIFAPNIASDGSVYFLRSSKTRQHQLFRARYSNGIYQQAQPLTFSNPTTSDYDPVPGPDQSYVVFASSGRAGADKKLHLYVALAHANDWDVHPLPFAGDTGNDSSPVLSRDGTKLYFTSDRGTGTSNVWVMPFRADG